MKGYRQLTEIQRYQIEALKQTEKLQSEIAQIVGVSESTISREFACNGGRFGYSARRAHLKAQTRKKQAIKSVKMDSSTVKLIEEKLCLDWSPEQISGHLRQEAGFQISHERIYQHVWSDKLAGGELYRHLRHSHKKRRKQYGSQDKRGQIRNRVSIDERPEVVLEKSRIGDWEIDTMIGKNHQGALITIVERVSKFTLIKKVDSKQADVVTQATIALLEPYVDKTLTITADNGKEFAKHETIAQALNTNVYFAHPYRSWERGLNENTNGLIRQYFTKGPSFETITNLGYESIQSPTDHVNL